MSQNSIFSPTHPTVCLRLLIFLDIEAETDRAEVFTHEEPAKSDDFTAHGILPIRVPERTGNVIDMIETVHSKR